MSDEDLAVVIHLPTPLERARRKHPASESDDVEWALQFTDPDPESDEPA